MPVADPACRGASPLARWALIGGACGAIGAGLAHPYLFVYLHQARGLGVGAASALVAWAALVALTAGRAGRSLAAHAGPRGIVLTALGAQGGGALALASAADPPAMLLAITALGAGAGLLVAPVDALRLQLTAPAAPDRVRRRVASMSTGCVGLGAAVSAFLLTPATLSRFQLVLLLDASACLAFAVVLLWMPGVGRVALRGAAAGGSRPRPALGPLRSSGATGALAVFAFGQCAAGFPAYATGVARVAPSVLGLAWAAHAATLVAGRQLARRLAGRRLIGSGPSRAVAAALLATGWALLGAAAVLAGRVGPGAAAAGTVASLAMLGLGEVAWRPNWPGAADTPLGAAAQADERASALIGPGGGLGLVVGPLLAGALFGAGRPGLWLALAVAGCLAAAGLLAWPARPVSRDDGPRPNHGEAPPAPAPAGVGEGVPG